MGCKGFWKRFISFALAFAVGVLAGNVFFKKNFGDSNREKVKPVNKIVYSNEGNGSSGADFGADDPRNFREKTVSSSNSKSDLIKALQIISKQKAFYTEEARRNQIQGKVVLRITFLANGRIGAILPITELPDGLTEEAIGAAGKIKFEPARRGGVPISVTKAVEYNFTIY